MWGMISVAKHREDILSEYLRLGYEPFTVTLDPKVNIEIVWLKREVKDEILQQQPEPIKRTGRRKTNKPKE